MRNPCAASTPVNAACRCCAVPPLEGGYSTASAGVAGRMAHAARTLAEHLRDEPKPEWVWTPFPIGSPYGSLSRVAEARTGRQRAYHVPPVSQCGLGRASPPVVRRLRRRSSEPPDLTTYRFWSKRLSILRLASLTAFSSASLTLTLPYDPGSQPPRCWESRPWPRGHGRPPCRRRLRCSESFAPHGRP